VWAQTAMFRAKPCSNMRESQQLFLGLQHMSRIFEENPQSEIPEKIEHHFGGFF
jgi:hypothetical protein